MRKRYSKKSIYKKAASTIFLIILATVIGYFISQTSLLTPGVDELTASYISFNNPNSTDILKITNISKMNNNKGKSNRNKSYANFKIKGKKNTQYQIILFPIGNILSDEDIYFYLENNKDNITKKLSDIESGIDGGKVIYQNTLDNNNDTTIRMWIDNKSKNKETQISYEVKIKQTGE